MSKKLLVIVLLILVVVAGGSAYVLLNFMSNRDVGAHAELLITKGPKAITDNDIATMMVVIKSEPVISSAIQRIDPQSPWANRILTLSPAQQHDYILKRLHVKRGVLPGTKAPSDTICIQLQVDDGEMAKAMLEFIINSFQSQVKTLRDGTFVEQMQLLDINIQANSQEIKLLTKERLAALKRISEITVENPKEIESRVSRLKEKIDDLEIQRKLAESQDKITLLNAAISESKVKVERDETMLRRIRPLIDQLEIMKQRQEESEKKQEQYSSERIATMLKEDATRLRVDILIPPTLDSR